MYVVTGYLYKSDKLLCRGMYEDLINFVTSSSVANENI